VASGTGANCVVDLVNIIGRTDSSSTGEATAVFCGSGDISYSDLVAAGTCDQESTITRTWTATDSVGNVDSCAQTLTVTDNTAPVIACPGDITVECSPEISEATCLADLIDIATNTDTTVTGTATATDNCDSAPAISQSSGFTAGSCPQEKVITRAWTATDACGNSSSCNQVITVADNTGPTITCPANATMNCDADNSSAATGSATATDNCNSNITIAESDTVASGNCPQKEVVTRTWSSTDSCGNVSSCDQIITTVDNEAPVITCPGASTVECMPAASGANCFADLVGVIGSTDSSNTGSATATDNCDTPSVSYTDASTTGTCTQETVITRSWTAADDCGNSSSCEQTVTVIDNTAPSITCPGNVTVNCEDSTSVTEVGSATATDNCDPNPTVNSSDSVADGTCTQEKVITRTWTATDTCGNSSSCDQAITIVDNTAPIITCPADTTLECTNTASAANCIGASIAAAIATDSSNTGSATATDNCDPAPVISQSDGLGDGSCPQASVVTRTWTGTDACGNINSCVQVITLADDVEPVITCPADTTVDCSPTPSNADCLGDILVIAGTTNTSVTGSATATDNCDPSPAVSLSDSVAAGTCPQDKVITRTWTTRRLRQQQQLRSARHCFR